MFPIFSILLLGLGSNFAVAQDVAKLKCSLQSAKYANTPRSATFVLSPQGDSFGGRPLRVLKAYGRSWVADRSGNVYVASHLSEGRSAVFVYEKGREPIASMAIAAYSCDGTLVQGALKVKPKTFKSQPPQAPKPGLGTCWLNISVCTMPWKYNVSKKACRAEGLGSWTPNGGTCQLLH